MSNKISGPSPILFNRFEHENIEGEAFVPQHIFSYMVSGTHEVWSGNKTYTFKAGDYRFFRRNQLTKYVKKGGQQAFQSIAVHIDQQLLKGISAEYGITMQHAYNGDDVLLLQPNVYFDRYIASLTPYRDHTAGYYAQITALKVKELVLLLLETNPILQDVLFDFSEPGKIDLEAFMNTHYRYNVGLDRFAFLTGRSLSTFKRDFATKFNTTPGKWLTKRRLEEAHFLITSKQLAPSDIYLDLGFEDLSHFSFAYKKAFGIAPSRNIK